MESGMSIRAYPTLPLTPLRVRSFRWIIKEKLISDIHAYVKRGEYGKASELLLIAVENAPVPIRSIWRPFLATLRQQVPPNLIGLQLDNIAAGMRMDPPYEPSMERVFLDLDRNRINHAYAALHTFSMDRGKKLALAHGYHGILVACLREIELERLGDGMEARPPCAHVFGLSEGVQFLLSTDDPEFPTKYTLDEAEEHLATALRLENGNTYFLAFYAQVLLAKGDFQRAMDLLKERYHAEKSIPCLRMIMSIDPREVICQTEHILDYLTLDPFASRATYFEPFMAKVLCQPDDWDDTTMRRLLEIVLNRVELGDQEESCGWECLAILLSYLRANNQKLINEFMEQRLTWWKDAYFASDCFYRVKEESDLIVYKAVCAQQLLDLESGHPVYKLLSGKLSSAHAEFVDSHMRILDHENQ
ncbi:hypothetical protein IWW39_003452 [Coemansia spiralis]|uniref:Uncharacterized protein n=1 Tax=Coemansia spiralis TaxID=417178 RepID=A0A9W8GIC8_9FUNG|nr:hypothetical protein IWW39_003452 [Coemansia spiralis]